MKYNFKKIVVSSLTALLLMGSLNTTIVKAADMNKFADGGLMQSHWGKESINFLMDKGALNGIKQGDKTFIAPNNTITRAEYTKILFDLVDPEFKKFDSMYVDLEDKELTLTVPSYDFPDWYEDYANYAIASDIYWATTKAEDWAKPITRAEAASVTFELLDGIYGYNHSTGRTYEYLEATKPHIQNNIKDRNDYNWSPYWNAIENLYSNGVLSGDEKGNFNPNNNMTRAEAASILHRAMDKSKRLEVQTIYDKEEDRHDYVAGENATIRQDDKYRRSVKDGDTFIDLNGKAWKVEYNEVTGTYNPCDPVAFDLGREDSLGRTNSLGGVGNGTAGGKFGDVLRIARNGHINWSSEFDKIEKSGFDKPSTPGTKDGELSEHKYYKWYESEQEWIFSLGKMKDNMKTYNIN